MTDPAPYDRLAELAGDVDDARKEVAAALERRNAEVIRAVDEGWPQDRVAAAIGVRPTMVTKILSAPGGGEG